MYMQVHKRLRSNKVCLKGDFSLIHIGCDYFMTLFMNVDVFHCPN